MSKPEFDQEAKIALLIQRAEAVAAELDWVKNHPDYPEAEKKRVIKVVEELYDASDALKPTNKRAQGLSVWPGTTIH